MIRRLLLSSTLCLLPPFVLACGGIVGTHDAPASAAGEEALDGASAPVVPGDAGGATVAPPGDDDDDDDASVSFADPDAATPSGDDGGGDLARCNEGEPYPFASVKCPSIDCVLDVTEGSSSRMLYDGTGDLTELSPVAATNAFVLVTGQLEPGNQEVLSEIPRSGGGPPVTLTATAFHVPTLLHGDDGALYIATMASDAVGLPFSLYRVPDSDTNVGAAAVLLGTATAKPATNNPALVYAGGYLYAAGDWGIGRIATSGAGGDAFTLLTTDTLPVPANDPYAADGFVVAHGYVFYATSTTDGYAIRRMPASGGSPSTIVEKTSAPHLAYDSATALLFADVLGDGSVVVMGDDGAPGRQILPPDYSLGGLEVDGTRIYAQQNCGSASVFDFPFQRYANLQTGETGYLTGDPSYPFVDGPTGVLHSNGGKTLSWAQILVRGRAPVIR